MSDRKICLILTIGIPGSGKTYLTNYLVEHYNQCVIPVSYDNYVVYDTITEQKWKDQRKNVLETLDNFISYMKGFKDNFVNNLNISYDTESRTTLIVIDDNMYYRSMRYEYYQIARKYQISFCQIFLNPKLESAINLNNSREESKKVPESIIKRMHNLLQEPILNSWEKFSIKITNITNSFEDIRKLILLALENPVEFTEEIKVTDPKNLYHEVDILLRNLIGYRVKNCSKNSSRKDLGRSLSGKKLRIIKELKSGSLVLPIEIIDALLGDCSGEGSVIVNNYFTDLLSK